MNARTREEEVSKRLKMFNDFQTKHVKEPTPSKTGMIQKTIDDIFTRE